MIGRFDRLSFCLIEIRMRGRFRFRFDDFSSKMCCVDGTSLLLCRLIIIVSVWMHLCVTQWYCKSIKNGFLIYEAHYKLTNMSCLLTTMQLVCVREVRTSWWQWQLCLLMTSCRIKNRAVNIYSSYQILYCWWLGHLQCLLQWLTFRMFYKVFLKLPHVYFE